MKASKDTTHWRSEVDAPTIFQRTTVCSAAVRCSMLQGCAVLQYTAAPTYIHCHTPQTQCADSHFKHTVLCHLNPL